MKKRLLGLGLLTISALAHAQSAELTPGVIRGSVSFSGETVSNGSFSASSNDGFSGSTSFSGSSYSLTTQGGHSYQTQLQTNLSVPSGSMYFYVSRSTQLALPVNGTVTNDYNYTAARVTGTVEVLGGTLNNFNIYSNASEGGESYSGYLYNVSGGGAASQSFSMPWVLDDSISIYGSANVVTTSGVSLPFNLDSQSIAVKANGGTASWVIDLRNFDSSTGNVIGTIDLRNPNGPELVSSHSMNAYGPSSRSANLNANGPYTISNALPGTYYMYDYSYFDHPFGGMYIYPSSGNGVVNVQAGKTATYDISADLGFATANLVVEGFVTTSALSYGYLNLNGVYNTPSADRYAYDYLDNTGEADFALVPGEWQVGSYQFGVYDFSNAASPLQAYVSGGDYNPAKTTVTSGTTSEAPTIRVQTVGTSIVFDVIEAAGAAEVKISNPTISGSSYGATSYKNFSSYGSYEQNAHPSVRIIGEPGTYDVQATGYVTDASGSQSYTQFGRFQIKLEIPVLTPVGADVVIAPVPGVELTFDGVSESGVTSVTISPIGPQPPAGVNVYAVDGSPAFYDVSTTARTSGQIELCVDYSDAAMTAATEDGLTIQSYGQGTGSWTDVTSSQDSAGNTICGTTSKLGIFALLLPSDDDNDGVTADIDNCATVSNADQADLDLDGQGDACDADDDNDGAADASENCPSAANPDQLDLDGDGRGDACDDDDDGDGAGDDSDNCPKLANADQSDSDGDGLGDACDPDDDGDGVSNDVDNCRTSANADQADLDGDLEGDACDSDVDGDGQQNGDDNCANLANPDQADLDGDGEGDRCDVDVDGDGVLDVSDNCAATANADQSDNEPDGLGDACDSDDDNDGSDDAGDNCPFTDNVGQSDADLDGEGDACDGDRDGDGTDNASDNCADASNIDQSDLDSDGEGDACDSDDDADDIADDFDNCASTANADQANNDGDSLGDACDADDDGDDVSDIDDNCALTGNADQANADSDADGDACDADDDNDSTVDDADNCPLAANSDQQDTDGDALGDACDPDDDNDGAVDAGDNCPSLANAEQTDTDSDASGDACDSDDDGDAVSDDADNCALTSNSAQGDVDGDGVGDACDPDDDNDGIADEHDNCSDTANSDQRDTDFDGAGDGCDSDDDDDGVDDLLDNCALTANSGQGNLDGDDEGDACDGDRDGDGVANSDDNCIDAANDQSDLDSDGTGDACDTDRDGDGVDNDGDNCPTAVNSQQQDNDSDSLGDACDIDDDNDGVYDPRDNCAFAANSNQTDTDLDAAGDACDTDDDDDGVADGSDNCTLTSNRTQADNDGDGLGDACDADDDNDAVADGSDNCPSTSNATQADFDVDGAGDACDSDIDGDSVANATDQCANTAAGAIIDGPTGCSIAQLCPCFGPRGGTVPWKNHGKYVTFVESTTKAFKEAGLITQAERQGLMNAAANSTCGN